MNKYHFTFIAEIAQLVERRTENPGVPSSILGLGTILLFKRLNEDCWRPTNLNKIILRNAGLANYLDKDYGYLLA